MTIKIFSPRLPLPQQLALLLILHRLAITAASNNLNQAVDFNFIYQGDVALHCV
jgi:hypothetical protein